MCNHLAIWGNNSPLTLQFTQQDPLFCIENKRAVQRSWSWFWFLPQQSAQQGPQARANGPTHNTYPRRNMVPWRHIPFGPCLSASALRPASGLVHVPAWTGHSGPVHVLVCLRSARVSPAQIHVVTHSFHWKKDNWSHSSSHHAKKKKIT